MQIFLWGLALAAMLFIGARVSAFRQLQRVRVRATPAAKH